MKTGLNPRVSKIRIGANSTWLEIRVEDVNLSAGTTMYDRSTGNFGEVEFRGVTKDFVESLRDKLTEILERWGTNDW